MNTKNFISDERISQKDELFCMAHQEAYKQALIAVKSVSDVIKQHLEEQENILKDVDKRFTSKIYIKESSEYDVNISRFLRIHKTFINRLMDYFNDKYRIGSRGKSINKELIPQPPYIGDFQFKEDYEKRLKEYEDFLFNTVIDYHLVIDYMFKNLNAKSIIEFIKNEVKAFLKEEQDNSQYEINNDTIILKDMVYYSKSLRNSFYSLSRGFCIIKAINYFEKDTFDDTFDGYYEMFSDFEKKYFVINGKKVKNIRCLKNGELKIKFNDIKCLQEFVSKFLK